MLMGPLLLDLQQRIEQLLDDGQHARTGAVSLLIGHHVGEFFVEIDAGGRGLARLGFLQAVGLRRLVVRRGRTARRDVLVERGGVVGQRGGFRRHAAGLGEALRRRADILQGEHAGVVVADDCVACNGRGAIATAKGGRAAKAAMAEPRNSRPAAPSGCADAEELGETRTGGAARCVVSPVTLSVVGRLVDCVAVSAPSRQAEADAPPIAVLSAVTTLPIVMPAVGVRGARAMSPFGPFSCRLVWLPAASSRRHRKKAGGESSA